MAIVQSITYGDAETRGKLRAWKKKLAADYRFFDAMYRGGKLYRLAVDLAKKTKSGRAGALAEIRRAIGPGATFERTFSNERLALFSILKPRDSVIMRGSLSELPEGKRESLAQDCVTVNYILLGKIPGLFVGRLEDIIDSAEGFWTLEVPDHALGRAVERSQLRHPGAIIREAHLNLLDLANETVPLLNGASAYIKAGPGCFVGTMELSPDISIGMRLNPRLRVSTWLHDDQLGPDQIALSKKGEPGNRLGDSVFLPRPLCEFVPNKDGFQVVTLIGSRKKST